MAGTEPRTTVDPIYAAFMEKVRREVFPEEGDEPTRQLPTVRHLEVYERDAQKNRRRYNEWRAYWMTHGPDARATRGQVEFVKSWCENYPARIEWLLGEFLNYYALKRRTRKKRNG